MHWNFIFKNEEKLLAPLVYSSFIGVATNSLWKNSVATSSVSQSNSSSTQIVSDYGVTP